jgi:integrase
MIHYYVKRPDAYRRSFAIYAQKFADTGKTLNQTLNNKEVDAINFQFKSKVLSFEEANKQIELVRNKIAGKAPIISNSINEKLLEKYFTEYFKKHPFVIDKDSAKHKYRRAVRAIGKLSLLAITEDEALEAMLAQTTNGRRREVAEKLNTLFTWLKRDVTVPVPPLKREPIVYITEDELECLVMGLESEGTELATYLANAYKTFFYAGPRNGEFRAFDKHTLMADGKTLSIKTQLDVHDEIRSPKNNKIRKAFIHPKGVSALQFCINSELSLSHKQLTEYLKRACIKYLNRYDITVHCLRHSYAVFLLSMGVPKALLAQSMGNSERVIDDHYAGFILSDAGIDTISRFVNK